MRLSRLWLFAAAWVCCAADHACAQIPDCVLKDPSRKNLPVAAVYISTSPDTSGNVVWSFNVQCMGEGISTFGLELREGAAAKIKPASISPNARSEEIGWKADLSGGRSLTWTTKNASRRIAPGDIQTFSFSTSSPTAAATNFFAANADCSTLGLCQSPADCQEKITPIAVRSAYFGNSLGSELPDYGYLGWLGDVIGAVPGVLCIDPGREPVTERIDWHNLVYAECVGEPYAIKNMWLEKQVPSVFQCADRFPSRRLKLTGERNVRLWWPLMYETAGTRFVLTVHYGTSRPFLAPGEVAPGYSHLDSWTWEVTTDLSTLAATVELFHELPLGRDEVPLISDETLYNGLPEEPFWDLNGNGIWDDGEPFLDVNLNGVWDTGRPGLLELLEDAETAWTSGDLVTARELLIEFEMAANDACVSESPPRPNPTGLGTGIAETEEHPACCKLISDAEYILSEQLCTREQVVPRE